MSNVLNKLDKSHFAFIPHWLEDKLTMKALLYGKEKWFKQAWNEYADICKSVSQRQIPDPDEFFDEAEKKFKGQEWYAADESGINFAEEEEPADILKAAEELEVEVDDREDSGTIGVDSTSDLEIHKGNF